MDLRLSEANVENDKDVDCIGLGTTHQVVVASLFGKPYKGRIHTGLGEGIRLRLVIAILHCFFPKTRISDSLVL